MDYYRDRCGADAPSHRVPAESALESIVESSYSSSVVKAMVEEREAPLHVISGPLLPLEIVIFSLIYLSDIWILRVVTVNTSIMPSVLFTQIKIS